MARPQLHLYPYRAGDIDRFTPRADFAAEKAAVGWAWSEGPPPGSTWSLWDESAGEAIGCVGVGGVFEASPGYLHAWAVLSDLTPRQWAVAGGLAEDALAGLERFRRPKAISATARASIQGAAMILQKLGFRPAGEVVDERVEGVIYQLMVRAA